MIKAAIDLGLTPDAARLLTLQTASGAAKMAQHSNSDVAALRENVTSPGGTTEQGLRVLNENDIDQLMKQVLIAARQRSIELADQQGEK
jgi:pyrroline-5-carboxylate reductase